MKFSIIVPVYNTSKYLKKCLDSVINQTNRDFEVIVINDGSVDNSLEILNEYEKKDERIKVITTQNQGLSMARNEGVKHSKGKYLLFLDSDDYIERQLLEKLDENINNNPDIVRFQAIEVDEDYKQLNSYEEKEFSSLNGKEAFEEIVKYHYIENAWLYLYNREFYLSNNFSFKKGIYHEDFDLIPKILIKARIVNSVNYLGYNYVQRNGSIMHVNDYDKVKKKFNDMFSSYKELITFSDNIVFKSYLTNSIILKSKTLNNNDLRKVKKEFKELKIYDNLINDTLVRKIKKLYYKYIY